MPLAEEPPAEGMGAGAGPSAAAASSCEDLPDLADVSDDESECEDVDPTVVPDGPGGQVGVQLSALAGGGAGPTVLPGSAGGPLPAGQHHDSPELVARKAVEVESALAAVLLRSTALFTALPGHTPLFFIQWGRRVGRGRCPPFRDSVIWCTCRRPRSTSSTACIPLRQGGTSAKTYSTTFVRGWLFPLDCPFRLCTSRSGSTLHRSVSGSAGTALRSRIGARRLTRAERSGSGALSLGWPFTGSIWRRIRLIRRSGIGLRV